MIVTSGPRAGPVREVPDVTMDEPPGKAAFARISLSEKILEAFDTDSNLLVHFPCSIAQKVEKRPVGELHVAVVAFVLEGSNAVVAVRKTIGVTKSFEAEPGSIRGDFALEVGRNLVHASDGVETAQREVALWFTDSEQTSWGRDTDRWIFE